MRRFLWAALFLCLATSALACESRSEQTDMPVSQTGSPAPTATPSAAKGKPSSPPSSSPTPTETPDAAESSEAYAPNRPLPAGPIALAAALTTAHKDLEREVEKWVGGGAQLDDPRARQIELTALFQQRIYRKLVRDPALAQDVLDQVHGPIRRTAKVNFEAGRALSANLVPVEPPVKLKTHEPAPPDQLLGFYEKAERRFGVGWEVLASVNFVETRFGRVLGPSTAGALGPMQFLPSTWEAYGGGGDIFDPHDAILGAARYLRASGAPGDIRGALFNYNRSDAYVDAVMAYADQMRRRPRAFYEYYFWQVFVRTTEGDMQLTGPGT